VAAFVWLHAWYEALARVLAVINDKGGVGKTSTVANLAGQLALAGYRVLVIDLNRQANLADDLGYRKKPDVDDDGAGLVMALTMGVPLTPVKGIRPNLDLVPGGTKLAMLTAFVISEMQQHGRSVYGALAAALAPIAGDYDVVLIDTPPENMVLGDLALACARWAILPTKSDPGGLVGMQLTADRFEAAREFNPYLRLLGVVLFGTLSGAGKIHKEVRGEVEEAFGGASPLFDATIRHSERVARDCRKRGLLAHELEPMDPAAEEALREAMSAGRRRRPPISQSVSADYAALAAEVLELLAAGEAAEVGV
jgi:cellulose biosynthesis protein BcsQ